MSIDMKTVKAITHNNKSVSSITDSNNNIIWGSYEAFPYRVLEYIHFNGAERIQTNFYAGDMGINYRIYFSADNLNANKVLMGMYAETLNNNLRRFYLAYATTSKYTTCIGNTWGGNSSAAPINTKLRLSVSINKNSSGVPRMYYYLQNTVSGATIQSLEALNSGTAGDLDTSRVLSLGCNRGYGANYDHYEAFWQGNVYGFQKRQTNASGTMLCNLIPVQRKSDSLCGMYDTVAQIFHPMIGTTITDAAAGPTVNEYYTGLQELRSISISGYTTTYNVGDTFSFDGTATATLYDPALDTTTTLNVTNDVIVAGGSTGSSGTKTVGVSYTYNGITKTAYYTITVNATWKTIWSGAKDFYMYMDSVGSSTTGTSYGVGNLVTTSYSSKKFRITMSAQYDQGTYAPSNTQGIWWGNGSRQLNFFSGTAPQTVEVNINSWGNDILKGVSQGQYALGNVDNTILYPSEGCYLRIGTTSGKKLYCATTSSGEGTLNPTFRANHGTFKFGIKITKIEQYLN